MEAQLQVPDIAEADKTPLVLQLLEIIKNLHKIVSELTDEIARLKGHAARPKLQPSNTSKLDKIANARSENSKKKRKSSRRR